MSTHKKGCLICGQDLQYGETEKLECLYCHKTYDANVKCKNGHFVCDNCHSLPANDLIENYCLSSTSTDPLELALNLMHSPQVKMHGPEHHFLVPAVLLAAYYNAKNDPQTKKRKLQEAKLRSSNVLGGFCGFYGDCGAAVGTGIFVSLVTNATPLSTKEWQLSNLMTAQTLLTVANHGGPRCCKRNSFLAITQATEFAKKHLQSNMQIKENITCEFTGYNTECLKQECPFHPKK
ncbi:MAG: DUF5714 domain-containing protein [Candidatus Bathyarchaeota archaeon]|nr:DUF5714 domain-containing protein [Candidatus Bathyarchaeota archaeon]